MSLVENPRIDPVTQADFINSPDWLKCQQLHQKYKPWKEALENGDIPLHSAQEYAIMLFQHGFQARGEGNYGIAAMTIWRPGIQADQNGKIVIRPAIPKKNIPEVAIFKPELAEKYVEMNVFGHNELFRQKKTNGHAERQSTEIATNIWLQVPDEQIYDYITHLEETRLLIFREAPDNQASIGEVTTLEPCPGCSEMIITAGYDWVLSLNQDVSHGALHPDRIGERLGPGWLELAKQSNIDILFSQENDKNNLLTYLPQELASIIAHLFFDTRQALDKQIGKGGVLMLYPGVKLKI